MSTKNFEHLESLNPPPLTRSLTTVTLTSEQFQTLFLHANASRNVSLRKLADATPLAVSCFLLAQLPMALDLLGFQGATGASGVTALGAFYGAAGIGLWAASIIEAVSGRTFETAVFGTFGGFWIAYGFLIQPTNFIAASYGPAALNATVTATSITAAAAGAATREYNAGLAMYNATWACLCFVFLLASLRTNVPFVIIFLSLVCNLSFNTAAYLHTASGHTAQAASEFKVAGGWALVVSLAGFWVDLSLLLDAVGFPISIPIFELSRLRFMQRRPARGEPGESKGRGEATIC